MNLDLICPLKAYNFNRLIFPINFGQLAISYLSVSLASGHQLDGENSLVNVFLGCDASYFWVLDLLVLGLL